MCMMTYSYGAKAPVENRDLVYDQLSLAHRYYNVLIEVERARREQGTGVEDKQKLADIQEVSKGEVRKARAQCGLYWGTYLTVEAAVGAAIRSTCAAEVPKFQRWDWGGQIAVQLQNGMSVGDLLSGKDMQVRVCGEGKRRRLHIRVVSEKRAPVWAVFPFFYHRDLPPSTIIKWVRVCRRKVGTKHKWQAQFVIQVNPQDIALKAPDRGVIAIDIGWRVRPDGLRVSYWADDEGNSGELLVPQRLLDRYRKTEDLRSIRDRLFNEAREALSDARKKALNWPVWLLEASRYAYAWKAVGKLAVVVLRWRDKRFPGDEALYTRLEGWRKSDKHLLEWEVNQRENVLRARRDLYRVFAASHVARYRKVVIEDMDLRKFAEKPGEEDEPDRPITKAARPKRFKASLSELLTTCIVGAVKKAGGVVVEAPPEYTTQTCSWCLERELFDAAAELVHTCSHCEEEWDQDYNAARNLLRMAPWCTQPGRRSRAKNGENGGETKAEARRKKGLATRRARARKAKEKYAELQV